MILWAVFGQGEEGEDPELQALRSELEEKALHVNKLVSATCNYYTIVCMYHIHTIFRTLSGPN